MDTPIFYVMNQSKAVRDTIFKALLQQFGNIENLPKMVFMLSFAKCFFYARYKFVGLSECKGEF